MTRRKTALLVAFVLFIIVTLVFIGPDTAPSGSGSGSKQAMVNSSALTAKTIREDGRTITRYENDDGKLTFAADLRYAMKTVTATETGETEEYFDEDGNPAMNSSGYYGVYREYDGNHRNNLTVYLDKDRRTMTIIEGFAMVRRTFDQEGRVDTDTYYDREGRPVQAVSSGYGKHYEYNEDGKVGKITFLDQSGRPMNTASGYASVLRYYYPPEDPQNGRVEYEFYYDDQDRPAAGPLGEYGVHREYDDDGNNSVITYLDREGQPAVNAMGYTTVRRTFLPNNYIETERYYDSGGNPCALSEGQYGVRKDEPGRTIHLDANGTPNFNIRNLINNHPFLVVVTALLIMILSTAGDRRLNFCLLALYLAGICYMTLLNRESGTAGVPLGLFRSYSRIFTDSRIRAGILKNIWLFVPLGTILYRLYPKKIILLAPAALSILIEVIQLLSGTGFCEPDDVISNALGGLAGYTGGWMLAKIKTQIVNRVRKGHGSRPFFPRHPGRNHSGPQ